MIVVIRFRKHRAVHIFALVVLGIYLILLISAVFFPMPWPEQWPHNLTWQGTMQTLSKVNLLPFNYGAASGHPARLSSVMRDIVANITLTIPFGFLVSYLTIQHNRRKLLYWTIAVGLSLEVTQLLLNLILGVRYHTVDITDVITNALGFLLGYGFCQGLKWIFSCDEGKPDDLTAAVK